MTGIFDTIPRSTVNPLLSVREFGKFCTNRFRYFPILSQSKIWFAEWEETEIFRPAFIDGTNNTKLYSIFQIWQIAQMWRRSPADASDLATTFRDFERVLRVLINVQDFYLPLVRTDRRVGEERQYSAIALTGGFMRSERSYVLLSSLQRVRRWALSTGHIDPAEILARARISSKELRNWADHVVAQSRFWDPLRDWRLLLSFCSYPMRQKLRWDALLAEDHYEIASILWAFLEDGVSTASPKAIWQGEPLPPPGSPVREEWLEDWYGEALGKPFEMLEFITNQYNLNPKPRAIVFTEGEEWRALEVLYDYYEYSPSLLGIEFRSISGEGQFKLANWQCFIEYMHEKQIIVYFALDDEGEIESE